MIRNSDSSSDSSAKMNPKLSKLPQISPEPHIHLFLRNNVYYIRCELKKVDGKRRFKRYSLRTSNFYVARQVLMDIQQYYKKIERLDALYRQLKIEKSYTNDNNSIVTDGYILCKDNDIELLKQVKSLYDECYRDDIDKQLEDYELSTKIQIINSRGNSDINNTNKITHFHPQDKKELSVWRCCIFYVRFIQDTLNKVSKIILQIQDILYPEGTLPPQNHSSPQTVPQSLPVSNIPITQPSQISQHTIKEVIDKMINTYLTSRVNVTGRNRMKKEIEKLLPKVGVSIDGLYDDINNQKSINRIEECILKMSKIGNKSKNYRIRLINRLVASANKMEPDLYKKYTIDSISEKRNSAQHQQKTYHPFSNDELIKMFNPEENFFQKYPDIFYSVLIAMFCGARTNGATTLRYTDIIDQDGIKCFDFKVDDNENPDTDTIKKLKTKATVRLLPVHSKLVAFGFLEYIYKYQERNKRRFQNFIFKRTLTINKKTNEQIYNIHYMRPFFEHLKKLGIKKDRWKAFHSFRNTLSNALEDCGVSDLYAKRIVGWEGNDTRSKHYSTRDLPDIQRELEKLQYPFLEEALTQISKEILEKEKKIKNK